MKIYLATVIAAIVGTLSTYAAGVLEPTNTDYLCSSITSFDGLPQNDVHDILQDSHGVIWAATNDGLCSYDGSEFRTHSKGENGLTSGLILCVKEDQRGNLWIGSADKGLFYYDRRRNRFSQYSQLFDNSVASKIIVSSIKSIKVDSKGVVWAYNRPNSTVVRIEFDYERERITSIESHPIMRRYKTVEVDIELVGDELYLTGGDVLYRYDETSRELQMVEPLRLPTKTLDLCSHDEWLFIGQLEGVYSYNTKTKEGRFSDLKLTPNRLNYIGNALYVTTNNGLFKLAFDFKSYGLYGLEEVDKYDNLISNVVAEDDLGGVWVGYIRLGMRRYSRSNSPFYLRDGIGNDLITEMLPLRNGDMLVGTVGSGAHLVDGIRGEVKLELFKGWTIYSIIESKYNGLVYLSNQAKIISYDLSSGAVRDVLNGVSVRDILEVGHYLYLATYDDGLLRLNMKSGDLVAITTKEGLPSQIVRSLMTDRDGNLWVCTSMGVVSIDANEVSAEKPKLNFGLFKPQDNHYAIPIIEDRDGDIWYGTLGSGLIRLCPSGGDEYPYSVTRYGVQEKLPSSTIKAIEEDGEGDIWISTNKGLCRISKLSVGLDEAYGVSDVRVDNYGYSQSLQNYEFGELSSVRHPSGLMLFGGVRGITYFMPENFRTDYTPVVPIVTDVKISGESVLDAADPTEVLPDGLFGERGVVLRHNQNDISIRYTGLNYSSSSANIYRFCLEGFNTRFVEGSGSVGEINYANLRPGEYKFILKVANSNGVWGSVSFELPVTIQPPFYATWYAYVIYLLICVVLIYNGVRIYHNIMKRRGLVAQAKFEKRKMEEILESRTRFFTNVSHEFRTPLTLILSPLQQLLEDETLRESPRYMKLLQTMEYSSRNLRRLIGSFLSYSKQQNGVLDAEVVNGDFREFAYRVFDQFSFWAQQRRVALRFIAADVAMPLRFDPYLMEQILSNIISNAIKYTDQMGSVTMMIDYDSSQSDLTFSIRDTGMGIDEKVKSEIFQRFSSRSNSASRELGGTGVGLYLSHKLVELHGGEIWFDSSVEGECRGTTFFVRLPKGGAEGEGSSGDMEERIVVDHVVSETGADEDVERESIESGDGALPSLFDSG